MPTSFVTQHLGQRHTDLLWRIGTAEGSWVYILILLEFQSTVDRRMALRMTLGYRPRLRYLLIEIRAQDPASLCRRREEKGTMTLIERARKWGEERDQLWLQIECETAADFLRRVQGT